MCWSVTNWDRRAKSNRLLKRFGMEVFMEDSAIIELFFARSEQAIKELDHKYGTICHKLSYNILNSAQDAEECVNDAYLGTWNAIPPSRPSPLSAFLCKIVRNLSLSRYYTNTAAKRNSKYNVVLEELENCLASPHTVETEIEEKELIQLIEDFLKTLSVQNRVIFLRRYWFSDNYAEIAEKTNISEKNVSVRLTRLRKQMRRYFKEKGVEI